MWLSIVAPAISNEAVNTANSNCGRIEDFPASEINQELPLSNDAVSKRKVRIKTSAKRRADRHTHRISGTEASLHTGCCRRTFMPSTAICSNCNEDNNKKASLYTWLAFFLHGKYLSARYKIIFINVGSASSSLEDFFPIPSKYRLK